MISPRRAVVELAHHLADHGRDPAGAIHLALTEGRAPGYARIGSTSCGDLLHAVAFAAGCRAPTINRDEHTGWRPGVNLSRWFVPPLPHPRLWLPGLEDFRPGDFGIYDYTTTRAHGFVFLGTDGAGRAITADFGQPGGKIYQCNVSPSRINGAVHFRGRRVDALVSLDGLSFTAPPETVGEWLTRHGLPVIPWVPYEYL